MAVSKVRKNKRKVAKQLRRVTFTSDLFEDEFTFPDQAHFNLGLISKVTEGNMGALIAWLRENDVEEDQLEAFESLEQEEIEGFLADWGKGSLADLPKSSA